MFVRPCFRILVYTAGVWRSRAVLFFSVMDGGGEGGGASFVVGRVGSLSPSSGPNEQTSARVDGCRVARRPGCSPPPPPFLSPAPTAKLARRLQFITEAHSIEGTIRLSNAYVAYIDRVRGQSAEHSTPPSLVPHVSFSILTGRTREATLYFIKTSSHMFRRLLSKGKSPEYPAS
ncbi:hypothetical protein LZ31DRAFT_196327 [Colletotrichum somersetense]|nr:hypothetical protein LZ31DRAFT_196327 [Colletotrichum somersetense]